MCLSLLMLTFVTDILIYESNNIIMTVISLNNGNSVCTRFSLLLIYSGSLLAVASVFLNFPGKILLLSVQYADVHSSSNFLLS